MWGSLELCSNLFTAMSVLCRGCADIVGGGSVWGRKDEYSAMPPLVCLPIKGGYEFDGCDQRLFQVVMEVFQSGSALAAKRRIISTEAEFVFFRY